jgi:N-acetyl-gamma-glutamyl-phosphate reductase
MNQIKIGILGATAYTGLELIKILSRHPHVEISFVSSRSYAGKRFCEVFPEMFQVWDGDLISPEDAVARKVDCVFSCLPHAVSAPLCVPFLDAGARVIDLSADFRLRDADIYKSWYKAEHPRPELLSQAVFGLPEFYREQIRQARILANPGCYPTSILLPLIPLLKTEGISVTQIIADSKSGVSGAGRALKLTSHFAEANENFSAYSIGRTHRHIAEIDQELSAAAGNDISITFSPHFVPMNRGILSTIYLNVNRTAAECLKTAKAAYENEPFVRVRDSGDLPRVRGVSGTNFCDLTFTGGGEGRPVVAVSTIDNLLKGASGQAVQNLNIMFGFDETIGLV